MLYPNLRPLWGCCLAGLNYSSAIKLELNHLLANYYNFTNTYKYNKQYNATFITNIKLSLLVALPLTFFPLLFVPLRLFSSKGRKKRKGGNYPFGGRICFFLKKNKVFLKKQRQKEGELIKYPQLSIYNRSKATYNNLLGWSKTFYLLNGINKQSFECSLPSSFVSLRPSSFVSLRPSSREEKGGKRYCQRQYFGFFLPEEENKRKKREESKLDRVIVQKKKIKLKPHQKFEVTLKKIKKLLFKFFLKNTGNFIRFLKQKIKYTNQNTVSFLIKTINLKILKTFKFFGDFFCILNFLLKIIDFMSKQTGFFKLIKLDNKLIYLLSSEGRSTVLHFPFGDVQQAYNMQHKFSTMKIQQHKTDKTYHIKTRQPTVAYLKSVFNTSMSSFGGKHIKFAFTRSSFFLITNLFFIKIKFLLIKQASFITYFLHKVLWKWTKKQHGQVSYQCLANKYWIFLQKLARFYFFEKVH